MPYDGVSLPALSAPAGSATLNDGATINAATYTRTNPYSIGTLTINGTVTFQTEELPQYSYAPRTSFLMPER